MYPVYLERTVGEVLRGRIARERQRLLKGFTQWERSSCYVFFTCGGESHVSAAHVTAESSQCPSVPQVAVLRRCAGADSAAAEPSGHVYWTFSPAVVRLASSARACSG